MIHRLLLAACFCALILPLNAFCAVDVVDDSENFALLEEQQVTESPVAHDDNDITYTNTQKRSTYTQDEPALARDDISPDQLKNESNLLNKVQGLQQEIQELRGQLDIQAHELKLLQEQSLAFYKDLDARLRGAPAKEATTTPATPLNMDSAPSQVEPNTSATPPIAESTNTPVARTNPAEEQINYLAAYELIEKKQFDKALFAMQTFVNKYSRGGYTANAEYWLGELYLVKKNNAQAIEHFNVVLNTFPTSSKCAASLLKIGYAYAAQGNISDARLKLQEVIKKYPDTPTAKLATTKLNTLKNQ